TNDEVQCLKDLWTNIQAIPSALAPPIPQTPWTSDVDAAHHSLSNVKSLTIDPTPTPWTVAPLVVGAATSGSIATGGQQISSVNLVTIVPIGNFSNWIAGIDWNIVSVNTYTGTPRCLRAMWAVEATDQTTFTGAVGISPVDSFVNHLGSGNIAVVSNYR